MKNRTRSNNVTLRFRELLHKLLDQATRGLPRPTFIELASNILLKYSRCDTLEIWCEDQQEQIRCIASMSEQDRPTVSCVTIAASPREADRPTASPTTLSDQILQEILRGQFAAAPPFYTRSGSFWTIDTATPVLRRDHAEESTIEQSVIIGGEYQSLALIPIPVDQHTRGVLRLGSKRRDFFSKSDIQSYEIITETLGAAMAHQQAQWALRERVKELSCLYGIAEVLQSPTITQEEMLEQIVLLLPPGWQYPEITQAQIKLNGQTFTTQGFVETPYSQSSPIIIDGQAAGAVEVAYTEKRPTLAEGPFLIEERSLLDAIAETLGLALTRLAYQRALRERVKELSCLYGISKEAQVQGRNTEEFLSNAVEILPPSWQYPEVTAARIIFDDQHFCTEGFAETHDRQTAEILVEEQRRGQVDVVYTETRPEEHEGPFLTEERSLITEVARQIGVIIERREAEAEKRRLQEQLRHADRLATIGQLAAGVAHELNEPLTAIIGFSQLVLEQGDLQRQLIRDIKKIEEASLFAREIIRKLLLFARFIPKRKSLVSLATLLNDGLFFLESRCEKEGIEIVRDIQPGLPEIIADTMQLQQVLVNLVVNAIQAMADGGRLMIQAFQDADQLCLVIADNGAGMSEEVQREIFIPFYTTKEIGQGTGLGLSVVHGIVTSHGGTVRVESEVGKGSRFEIRLPINTKEMVFMADE